jgi:hypothetical protein
MIFVIFRSGRRVVREEDAGAMLVRVAPPPAADVLQHFPAALQR